MHKAPASPVRLNPDLPVDLERVINKALEKDRELRYQNALDIRTDLKRLRRESDSGWTPVVAEAPVSAKSGRRWILYGVLAAAIIAIAVISVYFFFGRYKILEQLGKGSRREFYLADDTTLDRKVALKFLPEAFTGDPESMARYERESKLLAEIPLQAFQHEPVAVGQRLRIDPLKVLLMRIL